MTIQRINLPALLTATLVALGTLTALAQDTVRIAVPNHVGVPK